MKDVRERVAEIREKTSEACRKAGRSCDAVKILAAGKKRTPEEIDSVFQAGIGVIGENRVQEAGQKIPLCSSGVEWHMIGHLQGNKVREAVRLFSMIHSVDSLKLLRAIDRICGESGRTVSVCLEVNVAGESSKFGLAPGDVPAILEDSSNLVNVDLSGYMTVPPYSQDPEDSRRYFSRLRELGDRWADDTGIALEELSMGMSGDYEVAVEEGATWIRPGTALFGPRRAK